MRLRNIEFDLLYLGLLTKAQIKPLSRWEGEFGGTEIRAMKSLGLKTESVERCLDSGRAHEELVFSRDKGLVGSYTRAFMKKPISHSREAATLEGRLFGFPDCCVRSFADLGHLPSGLSDADQQLLFHRACPDCETTRELLPAYRATYAEARQLWEKRSQREAKRRHVAGIIPAVGLASCLLLGGCEGKKSGPTVIGPTIPIAVGDDSNEEPPVAEPNEHWISLESDSDGDYLEDEWEVHLGLDPSNPDTDGDRVLDGPQLAVSMWNAIHNPPAWIEVRECRYRGLVWCSKCGKPVNMGFVEITNTNRQISINIGFLCLHYMEHGSFAYESYIVHDLPSGGVVNPVELDSVLAE